MNFKTLVMTCGLAVGLLGQPVVAQTDKPSQEQMQASDDAYRVGTDIGMLYLSQHSARLRITLLLQECNAQDIASLVAAGLPNSVDFYFQNAPPLSSASATFAAQIARGYVLGYEAGVRTEFSRYASAEARQSPVN
jgi:hypothetical protein